MSDVAICPRCMDGACDDCEGFAWCDAIDFPCVCDCAETGHDLAHDIAADQAADRALSAHFEERA